MAYPSATILVSCCPASPPPSSPSVRDPFDRRGWVYELKYDGFRGLAYMEGCSWRLVSRNGNSFRRFTALAGSIARDLAGDEAVLDGEVVCLDSQGCPLPP